MNGRRFFAVVWRINALLLFVVGVLATAILCVVAVIFVKDATRTRHVDNVANVALGEVKRTDATLGNFETVNGVGVLRAPLRTTHDHDYGSGSRESVFVRNYLFYDPESRTVRWLKPSMDSLITQTWSLPNADHGRKTDHTEVFVYAITSTDTNDDGKLTELDQKRIAVSSPTGEDLRVLVDGADRVNEARLTSAGKLLVLYSVGAKLYAVEASTVQSAVAPSRYEIALPGR